ncbi:hypothetical protein OH76DRAFT_1406404 [Lentinus brumalis]|uniref:Uncharacterized protein n=1 Tax=Lentinus brumalis TaxID=2498619 RepID=A0A371D3E3_9APHY|nr:hypothetical protein OH76DRAFT_1406404 [Polyporus brumalis]
MSRRVQFEITVEVCSCSLFQRAGEAMLILQYVPGAVFSALRVYVLSRSKLLGLLVAALSLVPVGANLVHYGYQLSGVILPPFGCLDTDNTTASLNLRLVIISRAPLIATDILLIWITWSKLRNWGARRPGDIRQSRRLSLSEIMFRGGITYFAVLFTLNVLHLILSVTAVALDNGPGSFVTEFTAPITAILISHFLLELQEANKMVVGLDPDDPLRSSRDPSFISSLGNFVNPGLSTRSDDDSVELQVRSRLETPGEEEGGGQPETTKADESLVISPRDLA